MHDDQHIARLFLLDEGIKQGVLFPRWVGGLGFGFGYPLFNFYPPLIYYTAEAFHLLGFSLILSIKAMIITGFIIGATGMYLLAKRFMGKAAAFLSTTLYTFFTYHAVLVYVRGAFAEFFALSILPFVFLSFDTLHRKPTIRNTVLFGISFALLILAHPLIAFPTLIYIGLFVIFHTVILNSFQDLFRKGSRNKFGMTFIGSFLALALSAFFWLPSMVERKFTMVDSILLTELANYKIHFIYPFQFWFSQWGYGGSIAGPADGMSFQLGKIHILFAVLSVTLALIFFFMIKKKKTAEPKKITFIKSFFFFTLLLLFSLFMTTSFSSVVWDNVQFLSYLQFPWRFLTFAAIFISLCGGFTIFFISHIFQKLNTEKVLAIMAIGASAIIIFQYQKYFRPQRLLTTTDQERTTNEEISWRISRTSFEFVPKGVKTRKSDLGTTILDISKEDIPTKPFKENKSFDVKVDKNEFVQKWFVVNAQKAGEFQLNTFNFPGWHAYMNGAPVLIHDSNPYKLITIDMPAGKNYLYLYFEDTRIRIIGNLVSLSGFLIVAGYFVLAKVRRRE